MGTKAERRAARERVAAYHEACLAELVGHVASAVDRYRAGEIDAYNVDETIHHYRRNDPPLPPRRARALEVLLDRAARSWNSSAG